MNERVNKVDWRNRGVRIVRGGELDLNTPQTPGMTRAAAINYARAGADKLWAGTVTVEPNAAITARPIGVVGDHAAFDGCLWFITDRRSRKVQAIKSGATTFLIFEDHGKGAYLHLTGRASVIEDRRRLEELYTPVQRTWFPLGLKDPHITLVRFDADQGEYWDQHNGMLRLLAAFAKAVVTGTPGSSGNTGTASLGV